MSFYYCKTCLDMRQFIKKYDDFEEHCDVCGGTR